MPRLALKRLVEVLRSTQGWEMELVKGYLRGTHGKTQVCDTQLKFSPQALQDLQVIFRKKVTAVTLANPNLRCAEHIHFTCVVGVTSTLIDGTPDVIQFSKNVLAEIL